MDKNKLAALNIFNGKQVCHFFIYFENKKIQCTTKIIWLVKFFKN